MKEQHFEEVKDKDCNLLALFPSQQGLKSSVYREMRNGDSLTYVGHISWWYMKCAQHAAHNPKFDKMGFIQIILVVALTKIKGPAHMFESGHYLRNRFPPLPPPLGKLWGFYKFFLKNNHTTYQLHIVQSNDIYCYYTFSKVYCCGENRFSFFWQCNKCYGNVLQCNLQDTRWSLFNDYAAGNKVIKFCCFHFIRSNLFQLFCSVLPLLCKGVELDISQLWCKKSMNCENEWRC